MHSIAFFCTLIEGRALLGSENITCIVKYFMCKMVPWRCKITSFSFIACKHVSLITNCQRNAYNNNVKILMCSFCTMTRGMSYIDMLHVQSVNPFRTCYEATLGHPCSIFHEFSYREQELYHSNNMRCHMCNWSMRIELLFDCLHGMAQYTCRLKGKMMTLLSQIVLQHWKIP